MSDLKTFFDKPAITTADPSGDLIADRGGDPLIDQGGSSGLQPIWDNPVASLTDVGETPNSQSGLPTTPSRQVPSPEQPPMPPSLEDRSPGTINES